MTSLEDGQARRLRRELLTAGGAAVVGLVTAEARAAERNAPESPREARSVLEFGAVGNGVADDTAAFNAALAALAATGGELVLPAGKFLITSTVVVNKRITLRGAGDSEAMAADGATTLVKAASLKGPAFRLISPCSVLRGFTLQGRAGNGGDGIVIEGTRCAVENVAVYGMGQDGIRVGTPGGTNANLWSLINIRAKNNGRDGLVLSDKRSTKPGLADANGGTLLNADLQYNNRHGCFIENAQLNTFVGMVCQNNKARGLSVDSGGRYNTFVGGDWEGNGAEQVCFEAGSSGNTVCGGTSTGTFKNEGSNVILGLVQATATGTVLGYGLQPGNMECAQPKVLDWYEEGAFQPTLADAAGAGRANYAARWGRFTRIGNRVHFSLRLAPSGQASSGNLVIGGLPFQASASAEAIPVEIIASRLKYPGQLAAVVNPGATTITVLSHGSGVDAAPVAMSADCDIRINGSYEV
ncbi:right-handed parallel beta-helix repeat-containing protein [Azohydromonas caseinilytica]|uniref:Rhamnogalacturonase A/B/Epimerase-like pectate lyase domain-containing protein n=1 Tax=Azohydromonas caseinilytica TaxID=2728836 RepID=A0A848F4W1_9BURK|nr:right-handed parallel beta-helix repeat-containing protein [Azohydromonas caseinilytica]NML15087.1 hypothetical protein [Azohydromonas caseinilytica]